MKQLINNTLLSEGKKKSVINDRITILLVVFVILFQFFIFKAINSFYLPIQTQEVIIINKTEIPSYQEEVYSKNKPTILTELKNKFEKNISNENKLIVLKHDTQYVLEMKLNGNKFYKLVSKEHFNKNNIGDKLIVSYTTTRIARDITIKDIPLK